MIIHYYYYFIFYFLHQAVHNGCKGLITSSGGNAAFATAYSAQMLGVPYIVCVPTVTPAFVVSALNSGEGGQVVVSMPQKKLIQTRDQ